MATTPLAFTFVCHAGPLEPQAVLLAASLRRYAPNVPAVVAVPQPEATWGAPAEHTLAAFARFGIDVAPVEVPFGRDRPLTNKIGALRVPVAADRLALLDSDILVLGPLLDDPLLRSTADVVAKPADFQTYTRDPADWARTYAACDADVPSHRIASTVSGHHGPPFFNSGMVITRRPRELADVWEGCARALAATEGLPFAAHRWDDQPAFAVAVHKGGFTVEPATERLNYPAHVRTLPEGAPPLLCHYHRPRVIRIDPVLRGVVADCAARHPEVARVLRAHPAWAPFVTGARSERPAPVPDLLISGIPGAGAGTLAELLNGYDDAVALTDPPAVHTSLSEHQRPWGIPVFLRENRGYIADGRTDFRPASPDFLFAVANRDGAVLARADAVRAVLPHTRVALCVRDPYDTIADWKRTAERPPPPNPLLPEAERAALHRIDAAPDRAERLALRWAWWARYLLKRPTNTVLVDHEQLLTAPRAALAPVLAGLDAGRPPADPPRRAPVRDRGVLNAHDRKAIAEICVPLADQLGVVVHPEP
ncbi:hypothetical protein ACFVFQ_00180 [Streptomyces sp. NPDC057743]|uniref:hypothetical protein n=1 Tax=Streptomyces sp. NPDC057743 TaxID=3346236 RepID=UPI003680684F